ncbi:hypothetical protein JB92DRAFT_2835485 [Gautieria morchelliformis]|nr:hypothetical protein JB92DRAFT_2835485 [Gautieria morchelliformis]
MVLPAEPPHLILGGVHKSMCDLEIESYAVQDDMRGKQQTDTQTEQTYARYVHAYEKWWENDQWLHMQQDPDYAAIPALHFQSWQGSNGKTKEGTNVGKQVIKSVISTLENHRKLNQHLYTNIPGSQIRLRDEIRIREIEQATTHNEPDRHRKSQTLKAAGSSSAGSAYRGDSLRPLEWSDLGIQNIPNVSAGFDAEIADDEPTHNQDGQLNEHGVIHHRFAALCPAGALALHFVAQFHILNIPQPSFVPDFSDSAHMAGYGRYGRKAWYELKVFYASEITKPMLYDNKCLLARMDLHADTHFF